jgi:hypothetical protein
MKFTVPTQIDKIPESARVERFTVTDLGPKQANDLLIVVLGPDKCPVLRVTQTVAAGLLAELKDTVKDANFP